MKSATGQALAYVYGRETRADADIAQVLTMDEAAAHRQQHRQAARELLSAKARTSPSSTIFIAMGSGQKREPRHRR